jgi:zinc/manganese transport system substrate-binding protein
MNKQSKKLVSLLWTSLSVAVGTAFGSVLAEPAHAKLQVVATLPSFADIAAQVGGDEVVAVALTRGNQDPHFVDARPDLVLKLNRADLLIEAGLDLEIGWLPVLVIGSRNAKIQNGAEGDLVAASAMTLVEAPVGKIDRSMGDVHPGGNPHYMLDPRNGVLLAKAVAARLGKIDPPHAELFKKNAETFARSLEAKISVWEKQLARFKGKSAVTYHRSWSYFLLWAGIQNFAQLEPKPGIPPSADHVVKLTKEMKAAKVGLLLMEDYYPKGIAEQVAKDTGAQLLVLPTEVGAQGTRSYADVFDRVVEELVKTK